MPWFRVNRPLPVAGIPAAAAACSRVVSDGSCRTGTRPATVARPARTPLAAGDAGSPLGAIARPGPADNAVATRPAAIAAGSVSDPHSLSPITPPPRASRLPPPSRPCLPPPSIRPLSLPAPAWASAQANSPTNATAVLATGPAATSSSSPRHAPPTGDSARPLAVGRYDVSASARPGSVVGDDGVCSRDAASIAALLDTTRPRRHVLRTPATDPYRFLAPQDRGGADGPGHRSTVPSLGIAGWIGGPHGAVVP